MSVFIIAEIGINHNGDLGIAKQLIDVAIKAGCAAVKFQKRIVDVLYTKEFLNSHRESPWGETQRDQKEGLEFGQKEYEEIDRHCKGIEWFASTWDINSQLFLRQFDLKYNKVASAMLADKELLEAIASEQKYTFISTGMSTLEDIVDVVNIFKEADCPFELMHCVSTYPMDFEDANLNCIKTLKETFNCKVGYSGHENGLSVSYAAVALGATSIESRITIDKSMYGSAQTASMEPLALCQLVGGIRKIEKALGTGVKIITEKEIEIATKLRGHLK